MNKLAQLAAVACFLLLSISAKAQYAATAQLHTKLDNILLSEKAFYSDEENQIYYIDFEQISLNLSSISIKNAQGETLLKDEVLGLPTNTIYEIDLSQYPPGQYEIELRSFINTVSRKITINPTK